MESKGEINRIEPVFGKDGTIIELYLKQADLGELERLSSKDLRVKIVEWKERRSLNSNGYAWKLLGELAKKLDTSAYELYEQYLRDQPKIYEDEDGNHVVVTIPSKVPLKDISIRPKDGTEGIHWLFYKQSSDGKFTSYIRIRGSSSFDTSEMSHFISNIVFDCKEQGIETLTPQEIKEMNERWGIG